jgi:two-component system sensor histidine kinase SenX3
MLASELAGGRFRILEERFDPVALARAAVDRARDRLPANLRIELVTNAEAAAIRGDGAAVRSVLENLIDNAIKYSPEGGRIEVGLRLRPSSLRVSVRDEGLGIPVSEQERVFRKFHRLDPAMTRGVAGAGLGLYVCRELVRRMDGRIRLVSEPGQGSTFTVELPTAAD